MQMLLLCKHSHHDESVQVDAFTKHPEIIAAQHVHVEEVQHLTANLQREPKQGSMLVVFVFELKKRLIYTADIFSAGPRNI